MAADESRPAGDQAMLHGSPGLRKSDQASQESHCGLFALKFARDLVAVAVSYAQFVPDEPRCASGFIVFHDKLHGIFHRDQFSMGAVKCHDVNGRDASVQASLQALKEAAISALCFSFRSRMMWELRAHPASCTCLPLPAIPRRACLRQTPRRSPCRRKLL